MKFLCKLFGHKYEPRFSIHVGPPTKPPKHLANIKGPRSYTQALDLSRERKETYVCDICARCGDMINAQPDCDAEISLGSLGDRAKPAKHETVQL